MHLPQIIALSFCVLVLGAAAFALLRTRGPMTDEDLWRVKRVIVGQTDIVPELAAKVVRWKLSDPRFTETEEDPGGREFQTTFRRDQWSPFLKLRVKVMPAGAGSEIILQGFPAALVDRTAVESFHPDLAAFVAGACSTKILNPA
jgi:hypothetical protein